MTAEAIGSSYARTGGLERVTGAQQYAADIRLNDVLQVKLVHLDVARARILSIDTREAEAVPGVRCVMTAADLPDPMPRYGPHVQDRPVLAVGQVNFHGEFLAAVAAETKEAAEEAARRVKVEYELLPAIFTVDAALAPEAFLVQDPAIRRPNDPLAHTNKFSEHHFGWGDVEAAAAGADLVVENTYEYPMVTQFAIEPHACLAAPDGDGVVVWSTIQHPFQLQKILAKALGLPLSKVRVIAPDLGGGFGGKQWPNIQPLLAFMALKLGRPVRLVLTLEEAFQQVRRTSAKVHIRTGVKSDGTLVFEDIVSNFLVGAYADIADRVVSKGNYLAAGPYRVPAVRIVARGILSNTPPATAMRGFGVPETAWAREMNLDDCALALGVDRLEIRLRNLAHYQDQFVPGDTPADGRWEQTVQRAAELIDWGRPLPPNCGRGIAVAAKSGPTTGLSYSTVRLLADGSALVFSGTSDMGQGARTVFAQIAAEELGIPVEKISVVMGDTSVVPFDQQTSASRSTVIMGTAVLNACRDVQAQVRAAASELYGVEESAITVDRGVVLVTDEEVALPEVAKAALAKAGGEYVGNGIGRKRGTPGHPLQGTATFFEFNCTAIEVQVDPDTGELTVLRHVTVGDTGKSLNPMQVRGQDDGAAIQGLGHAMMEHYIFDETGRVRNLGAIDYRIPTSKDLPLRLISEQIENGDGPGPYGAKGVSEGSILCVAPALGAAVRDAIGVAIRDLPLTPERVWRAMRDGK
ncbi:MAG: xanthine dehydrogenase family protein molybdopterin-binding subunit [Acidimicrobiia bacterium]|jgi:CO/xanthine dehydrogenase Mo-binding subunit|nr:xanthine dehydrogenase family protein molybdopterin-binding subunit [Acidimicrobiia bacterium]